MALDPARRDGRILRTVNEPGRKGESVALPEVIEPALRQALGAAGIDSLYSHQAEAFAAAQDGGVVVTTATASGKSLAFNLPVLDSSGRS